MKLLHKIIFWSHLLAGVSAGLVIFIMSFTGVVLMYEPQISDYSNVARAGSMPGPDAKTLELRRTDRQSPRGQSRSAPGDDYGQVRSHRVGGGQSRPRQYGLRKSLQRRDSRRTVSRLTISCATSSIGTAGSAPKAKAAPRLAPSPAPAIWRFSGSPLPASISGGRAAGNGAD